LTLILITKGHALGSTVSRRRAILTFPGAKGGYPAADFMQPRTDGGRRVPTTGGTSSLSLFEFVVRRKELLLAL